MGACFGKKGFDAELDGEAALDKKSSKTGKKVTNPMLMQNLGEDADEADEIALEKALEAPEDGPKKSKNGKKGKKGEKGKKGKRKDKESKKAEKGKDTLKVTDNPFLEFNEDQVETVTIEDYRGTAADEADDHEPDEPDPLFDGTEEDQAVLTLGSGNKPLFSGTLLKLGGGEGKNKWQVCVTPRIRFASSSLFPPALSLSSVSLSLPSLPSSLTLSLSLSLSRARAFSYSFSRVPDSRAAWCFL